MIRVKSSIVNLSIVLALVLGSESLLLTQSSAATDFADRGAAGLNSVAAELPFGRLGDGVDGELTVTNGQTFLANETRSGLTATAGAGQSLLNLQPANIGGWAIGQEVLILQMQGTGAGTYEFGAVAAVDTGAFTLTLQQQLTSTYTVGANETAQVIHVPHYQDVTVESGGTLTAGAWEGNNGGVLIFRSNGTVSVEAGGLIDASNLGFRGGSSTGDNAVSQQGESHTGLGANASANNAGGGGGGLREEEVTDAKNASGGGGGGYGAAGSQVDQLGSDDPQGTVQSGGAGGTAYGNADLTVAFLPGSGGGEGGGLQGTGGGDEGGDGGAGGGALWIAAGAVSVAGEIKADGQAGQFTAAGAGDLGFGGGGGGAGGAVRLEVLNGSLGTNLVTAAGGAGGPQGGFGGGGGAGGVGRIHISSCDPVAGTTSPAALTDALPCSDVFFPLAVNNFAPPVPNAPTLLSPANGSAQAKLTFDWTDVADASNYQFQLSPSNTFNVLTVDANLAVSQYAMTSSLSGAYYWRVRVTTPVGLSPFSTIRNLTLVNYNGDDDGDSLRNGWELHGYDYNNDNTIDVNLPSLGANYRHKDIYVEMDYMVNGSTTYPLAPNQTVLNRIVATFQQAPVTNPDGVTGINIHLELGNQVPFDSDLNPYFSQFTALKNTHFNSNRAAIYHYMIWANTYDGTTSSGISMGIPATDFIVTLGGAGWNGGTDDAKTGTFIHEFGHNLGLKHGGNDHVNYKPNYLSVMNYFWQISGVYRNGSFGNYDYQRFSLPSLNENSLNEKLGLNGGGSEVGYAAAFWCPNGTGPRAYIASPQLNFNCDNDWTDTNVSSDTNLDGSKTTLGSQNNWASIVFNGGGPIGSSLPPQMLMVQIENSFVDLKIPELTYEENQHIQEVLQTLQTP